MNRSKAVQIASGVLIVLGAGIIGLGFVGAVVIWSPAPILCGVIAGYVVLFVGCALDPR